MRARALLKTLTAILPGFALCACVQTEPRLTAPHINLSPATVFSAQAVNNNQTVDFGMDVSANESDSLENLASLPGVRIRRVERNGSAAAAELRAGDIILSVNGVDTNHPDTFAALLQKASAGETLLIKVRRDTTVFTTDLVGQTRAQANIRELYRADPLMSRAGYNTVTIEANGQQLTGAKIAELFDKSPLPEASLHPDDIIITADQLAVESAQGLVNYFMSKDYGTRVALQYIDAENQLNETTLTLWDPGRRIRRFALWPLFSYQSDLSPSTTRLTILDLWIVSLFKYQRQENERNYQLFTLFKFGTGAGELVDSTDTDRSQETRN